MASTARLALGEFREGISVTAQKKSGMKAYTLHGHDFYELDIILSGKAEAVLNDESMAAAAGQIYFLTPEDFHSFLEASDLDIYNIHFTEDAVPPELLTRLTEGKTRLFVPTEENFTRISRLAATVEEFGLGERVENDVLCRLLECILLLLPEGGGDDTASRRFEDMQRAIVYIHAHFKENPSLTSVAASLHLNERYFCKKFKEYTGKTYKDFLKEKKLRYARRLVLATSLSVTEIAVRSGYGTLSHFNREFKSFFGMSPLILKKRYK